MQQPRVVRCCLAAWAWSADSWPSPIALAPKPSACCAWYGLARAVTRRRRRSRPRCRRGRWDFGGGTAHDACNSDEDPWGEPDRRLHVRADGCAPVHDRHRRPESPGAAQEVPRQFAARGSEQASGSSLTVILHSSAGGAMTPAATAASNCSGWTGCGVDGGRIVENIVLFDTAAFETHVGAPLSSR